MGRGRPFNSTPAEQTTRFSRMRLSRRLALHRPAGVVPSMETLVDAAQVRWRIKNEYEDLTNVLGLAYFEGPG